eukprot:scaffold3662_cov388-Prasinococcus_capsulatus_cf.AAC.3
MSMMMRSRHESHAAAMARGDSCPSRRGVGSACMTRTPRSPRARALLPRIDPAPEAPGDGLLGPHNPPFGAPRGPKRAVLGLFAALAGEAAAWREAD